MKEKVGEMGVVITTKQPVFRQGNKVSKEPIYPIFLSELQSVNSIKMDVI